MIDSGIREGIATISHGHAKANNEYMETQFDPAKQSKFIQLPTSGFKWMTNDELDDGKHQSCILEVDIEYPEHLHNDHNDYPLASECVKIGNVEK